ncbi:hypothetical protein ZWY2020_043058 [Hordeum vulgare]|nr:hypothetical protein ZWY2020_043058 [Hordeum vulgare]
MRPASLGACPHPGRPADLLPDDSAAAVTAAFALPSLEQECAGGGIRPPLPRARAWPCRARLPPSTRIWIQTSKRAYLGGCAAQETRTKEHLYVVSEYKKEFEEQKAEITRKEGENQKLNEKYVILENLSRAQGKMIKNVKCNHLKEKERLIEERRKMKLQISQLQEVLANSEAEITEEVTKLKNELACMTLSNEKLTEEVATSSSWNQLLNEKMK